jgi:hydrogenase nickel incorporation protein HypB
MCVTCGCGGSIEHDHHGHDHQGYEHHGHDHHGHDHDHDHQGHDHAAHEHGHIHHPEHSHAPGIAPARMVKIEQDILAKNNRYAAANRDLLGRRGVLALNLLSSPGSGKTTLLVRTVEALKARTPLAVIEGDQATSNDADRIRATGVPALQINTGKGCHLDAHMVGHALERLMPEAGGILFIENVGNLVCPAAFDLGEAAKVVVFSVTEGEDKPLKYPDMFHAADLVLLNKVDLAPHCDFDMEKALAAIRAVNHRVKTLPVSARTGEGFAAWLDWLEASRQRELVGHAAAAPASSARVA